MRAALHGPAPSTAQGTTATGGISMRRLMTTVVSLLAVAGTAWPAAAQEGTADLAVTITFAAIPLSLRMRWMAIRPGACEESIR